MGDKINLFIIWVIIWLDPEVRLYCFSPSFSLINFSSIFMSYFCVAFPTPVWNISGQRGLNSLLILSFKFQSSWAFIKITSKPCAFLLFIAVFNEGIMNADFNVINVRILPLNFAAQSKAKK